VTNVPGPAAAAGVWSVGVGDAAAADEDLGVWSVGVGDAAGAD